jgi:uncharacterized protein (DUF849 family)
MLERFNEFQHAWERDYLESSRDLVFRNTFKDVEYALRTSAGNGTRFEFECYDIGHLYNVAHFLDRGFVQPPLFVQSVFGILGGIGTHPEDVAHMKRTADLHALPNANLAYSVYVVLHETTERITQELIDSRVMGLVRCGCERAVILAHRPLARDSSRQQTLPLSSSFLVVGSFPRKTSENLKTKRCLVNYAWLRTKL